jgi:hypothetical protein
VGVARGADTGTRARLPLPTRHRTYQPSPYFMRGELPRVALAILREVGEPLPIRVIAARALAGKDCHAPTRRIFKMTLVRLQQLFGRLEWKGLTYTVERGKCDAAGAEKRGRAGRGQPRPQVRTSSNAQRRSPHAREHPELA